MHFHIFTNDLRYIDNDALGGPFVAIFHLNSAQFRSNQHAVNFMIGSLKTLKNMNIFNGSLKEFVSFLKTIVDPNKDRVTMHKDYTLYSLKRESAMPSFVELIETDRYLSDPVSLLKFDGSSYKSFGAFCKNALSKKIRKPKKEEHVPVKFKHPLLASPASLESDRNYGRIFDMSRLRLFDNRDDMSSESLMLSPYMTFGCYSIREIYWATTNQDFRKQMMWREFYQCILLADPLSREYTFLEPRFKKFQWTFDKQEWSDFMRCKTGILIVDAAMRQLLQTGFMNNRARMIWATYLIKYLQINPYDQRYGAVHIFSKYLIDCSTSQNKLNIEWILGSLDLAGRRYSPAGVPLAGRKIDISNSKAIRKHNAYGYIRKWLPEFKEYSDKQLLSYSPAVDLDSRYRLWISKCRKIDS